MISERQFATYSSLWHQLCPLLESYVRSDAAGLYERFAPPLRSSTEADRRALVSEAAYCFARASSVDAPLTVLDAARAAESRLGWSGEDKGAKALLTAAESREVEALAERIRSFILRIGDSAPVFDPLFAGCGYLSPCRGDLLVGAQLIEIKTVERNFGSQDFRQALTYTALNHAGGGAPIDRLVLLNPRRGVYLSEDLDSLCREIATIDFAEFAERLIFLLSSSGISR